jgi:hypothetical protein
MNEMITQEKNSPHICDSITIQVVDDIKKLLEKD